jgi:hypothetical protein
MNVRENWDWTIHRHRHETNTTTKIQKIHNKENYNDEQHTWIMLFYLCHPFHTNHMTSRMHIYVFEFRSGQICYFSDQHPSLWSTNKGWLIRSRVYISWSCVICTFLDRFKIWQISSLVNIAWSIRICMERVSELLLSAKRAICQLYHSDNKSLFDEMTYYRPCLLMMFSLLNVRYICQSSFTLYIYFRDTKIFIKIFVKHLYIFR